MRQSGNPIPVWSPLLLSKNSARPLLKVNYGSCSSIFIYMAAHPFYGIFCFLFWMLVDMGNVDMQPVSCLVSDQIHVIIFTLTPRFKSLLITFALSCLGGSKRGMRPTNCHKPPKLSFLPSGTSWYATTKDRNPLSADLSITAWTLHSISELLWARFRICSGAPLLTQCIFPWPSVYVRVVLQQEI